MSLFEFNLLNETQQAEILWENGVHIGERADQEHTIVLYQIEGFYVEVFYHRGLNAIKRFRSFSSTDQLMPYTNKINIAGLGN
jgi:hypothetical protein